MRCWRTPSATELQQGFTNNINVQWMDALLLSFNICCFALCGWYGYPCFYLPFDTNHGGGGVPTAAK
jgi:hypothetical protein